MISRVVDGTTTRRPRQLAPERDDLVDAGAVLLLGVVALLEFHTTFSGWNFLIVGGLGLVLGMAITHVANVLRQPSIVLIVMGVVAFFLLGGAIALHGAPGASVVPTPDTLRGLASGSIHGWRDLLTTVPPVDGTGPLLVLPYILGLFLGLGAFALARRGRWVFGPALVPVAVFLAVILLGSLSVSAAVPTATVFAIGTLLWISERGQRLRPVVSSGSARKTRFGISLALFAIAGSAAYLVGPSLPGSSDNRVLIRKDIVPPFNVGDYPSPLGEFRLYAQDRKDGASMLGLKDKELFSVSGSLPAKSPIVFATLDAYNGSVWAVTNQSGVIDGKPNSFLRVGRELDNPARGPSYSMHVKVMSYSDYWLPTAGAVQAVGFGGSNAVEDTAGFRYNLATGTGVIPSKISSGDTYNLKVAGVAPRMLIPTDSLLAGSDSTAGSFLKDTATALAGNQGTLTNRVLTMAHNLQSQGRYTTGDDGSGFEYYLPGQSVARLTDFVKGVIPGVKYIGDDEQFAAAYALMIEQLGVPARVLTGVESLPPDRTVRGRNVTAWVEVRSTDGSWLTIPSDKFISSTPPEKHQITQNTQQDAGSNVPPPPQGHPKSSLDNSAVSSSDSHDQNVKRRVAGFHLPAWLVTGLQYVLPPVAALVLLALSIVTAKEARRRRRRTQGSPAERLARGWREVVDHARDLGSVVTDRRATRREQAQQLADMELGPLAVLTDRYVFGPDVISEEDAATVWTRADEERKRMSAMVSRRRRWLAAVSIATFLPSIPTGGPVRRRSAPAGHGVAG